MAVRILFLIDSLDPGGSELALVHILENLDREAFTAEVAYLWEPSGLATHIEALGVRVHRVRARGGDWSLLSIPRVRTILRDGHFQVIHTMMTWSSIVGRVAGRWAGARVVSDLAGGDAEGWVEQVLPPREARRVKTTNQLDSWTARVLVDRFIAPTSGGIRPAGRSKVVVVPRGQDLEALAVHAAESPDPPLPEHGAPMLLAVGDLTPPKDQRSLVDAMGAVHEAFPNATLVIAGEGSLHRMLEDRAKPLGEGAVFFLGRRRDVPALLAACDLFVLPSVWEPTGAALVEAMALGRPIVATRIPVVLDAVRDGETAVLAKAGESLALADAILRVLRDPTSAKAMGERAREASARFDVRATVVQLQEVYTQVVQRKKRRLPFLR